MKKLTLLSMAFCFALSSMAQSYQKTKEIKYFQLPAIGDTYMNADVFITYDGAMAGASNELAMGFGKATDALDKKTGGNVGAAMQEAVNMALSPKAEPYSTWKLFPPHFTNGKDRLKVVVTYTPDENARPMAMPPKDNKGIYQVRYRVFTHVKVFDASNKLMADYNFGIISGTGGSKEWPAPATTAAGAAPKVTVAEEGENKNHPYEDVCIEGALDAAKRVVYGMYGIAKFKEDLGVYSFKELPESKVIASNYTNVLTSKAATLLSNDEMAKIKECITYWESNLDKVAADESFAMHHNIAIASAWVLDAAKAKQHLAKMRELNKETFDKMVGFFSGKAASGTSFTGKDMNRMEVFNSCQPFIEYYADGINKHPTWPPILEKPYDEILYAFVVNSAIAGSAKMPFPLPIYPVDNLKTTAKKITGEITVAGKVVKTFSYKQKKGQMLSVVVDKDEIPFNDYFKDGADDGSFFAQPNFTSFNLRSTRAHKDFGVTPKGYFIGAINLRNCVTSLPIKVDGLKYWNFTDASVDVNFGTDLTTLANCSINGGLYLQSGSWDEYRSALNIKSSKINANGYPEEYVVDWLIKGYNGSDFKKSETYPVQWEINGSGDWTKITVGDVIVTRTFQ